ncbi:unnamed protein product [Spirodela intermedia]|uniref:Uncharacterized protein n=2 Tax=Spirodela intermedia TaxID=51605 RepID=A0A7I8IQP9_SPIIN|nr:unnamed protein product [Spirodela intermedia]CAA6660260.1 unnamed protein product [Spirodela intermedia]CAA7396590.1 unnamed protein product [Spirodela intermedia]
MFCSFSDFIFYSVSKIFDVVFLKNIY